MYGARYQFSEVFYDFMRSDDEAKANDAVSDLESAGVAVIQDMDTQLWHQAGKYKATLKRISLADCFAMALANRVQGELVTSDHGEFDQIAAEGICTIKFIR